MGVRLTSNAVRDGDVYHLWLVLLHSTSVSASETFVTQYIFQRTTIFWDTPLQGMLGKLYIISLLTTL